MPECTLTSHKSWGHRSALVAALGTPHPSSESSTHSTGQSTQDTSRPGRRWLQYSFLPIRNSGHGRIICAEPWKVQVSPPKSCEWRRERRAAEGSREPSRAGSAGKIWTRTKSEGEWRDVGLRGTHGGLRRRCATGQSWAGCSTGRTEEAAKRSRGSWGRPPAACAVAGPNGLVCLKEVKHRMFIMYSWLERI